MNDRTQAERYFLERFGTSTLAGAAELAASEFDDGERLPVNVVRIATQRGIRIKIEPNPSPGIEARLLPRRDSFRIELKQGVRSSRRRFSLAHELGHTLFYARGESGLFHRIGVISSAEKMAEERICNLFAQALLVPRSQIERSFARVVVGSPNSIIAAIENVAQQCDVSPLVVLFRLRVFDCLEATFIAIWSQYTANASNGADTRLRVASWFSSAWPTKIFVGRNRSVRSLGLTSPGQLFESWRCLPQGTGGRFALEADSTLVIGPECRATESHEILNASSFRDGKWQRSSVPVSVASYLFARHNSTEQDAYLISVLTPLESA